MKQILITLFIGISSIANYLWATSQPIKYREGTYCTEPYLHKDIELVSQQIHIKLINIQEVELTIHYSLKVKDNTIEIPLLYIEHHYFYDNLLATENMYVTVDNIPVHLITKDSIPEEEQEIFHEIYGPFGLLDSYSNTLTYLPAPLEKGIHSIRVQYKARLTANYASIWNEYYLYYNYEPLLNHPIHSGELEIEIQMQDTKAEWKLMKEKLSGSSKEFIESANRPDTIKLFAEMPKPFWVKMIETITLEVLFLIWGILLFIANMVSIYKYRVQNPTIRFSEVAIIGGILLPFFQFLFTPLLFSFIYNLLARHGFYRLDEWTLYALTIISLFLIILYVPFSLLVDYIIKRMLQKRK